MNLKIQLVTLAFQFVLFSVSAQVIVSRNGTPIATDEITKTILANPEDLDPGYQKGYAVNFSVTYGLMTEYRNSYIVKVNQILPLTEKGFFFKKTYAKPGTYIPCSELLGACNSLELAGVTVVGIWTYNGKEFSSGGTQLISQNGNYLNATTPISPPGGGVIPSSAVKSGEAKLTKIKFVSWNFRNDQSTLELLAKKYQR